MTEMRYEQLGASGLVVSAVGLGCNSFGATLPPQDVPRVVSTAIESGITLFDTADTYGGEPGMGEELLGAALRGHRDEVVIATKFGMDTGGLNGTDYGVRGSRRYIRRAVEGSLRRLGTDHIDLYQLHRLDPVTPMEETLDALHELVQEGKVLYLGCSHMTGWQLVDADWLARTSGTTPFISVQNEYNLLSRGIESEVVPAAAHVGAGILPYFPLASGLLTGKYRRGEAAPQGSRLARRPERLAAADFDRIEALAEVADQAGVSLLTLALGGLAAQPGVSSVIAGARTPEQVRANVEAGLWEPDAQTLVAIDEASPGPAAS